MSRSSRLVKGTRSEALGHLRPAGASQVRVNPREVRSGPQVAHRHTHTHPPTKRGHVLGTIAASLCSFPKHLCVCFVGSCRNRDPGDVAPPRGERDVLQRAVIHVNNHRDHEHSYDV